MYRAIFSYRDPNRSGLTPPETPQQRSEKPPREIDLGLFSTYELAAEEGLKVKDYYNDILKTTYNTLLILKTEAV